MKISCCFNYQINKYGYPPSVDDILKAFDDVAEMGFKYTEVEGFREQHMREVHHRRHEIKERCDAQGMQMINFSPVLPGLVSIDRAESECARELFALALETAQCFGCSTVQITSFPAPLRFVGDAPYYQEKLTYGHTYQVEVDPLFDWDRVWQVMIESFRYAAEKAQAAGIKVAIEPRAGETISNSDAFLRLADAVKHENLGCILDCAHQYAQKEILPLSVEKLKGKIVSVHAADNDGSRNEHLAVGRGTIDWYALFSALKKHHFQGVVAVDVGDVPDFQEQFIESRKYLEDLAVKLGI